MVDAIVPRAQSGEFGQARPRRFYFLAIPEELTHCRHDKLPPRLFLALKCRGDWEHLDCLKWMAVTKSCLVVGLYRTNSDYILTDFGDFPLIGRDIRAGNTT